LSLIQLRKALPEKRPIVSAVKSRPVPRRPTFGDIHLKALLEEQRNARAYGDFGADIKEDRAHHRQHIRFLVAPRSDVPDVG
jgi:hypothetical protein